ncbi:MAG: HD domain-containing protein [bacterium]|nr:HD domain-containing protein [bacterium]
MSADTLLLSPLLDLLALDRLPRTGWVIAGVPAPESVAGHVLGAAHVALALAPRVNPALDLGVLLSAILVHDAPEAASGDLPKRAAEHLPGGAKAVMEDGLARELLGALSPAALAAYAGYLAQDTRESRLARLCDKLQLGVRLVGYVRAGQAGLGDFRPGLEALDCGEFPAAQALQAEILAALDAGA